MSSNAQPRGLKDRLQFGFIRAVLWFMRRLPYERRVAFSGWVLSRIVAPMVGWRKRIAANIRLVAPETTDSEIHRIQRAVPDNFGRTLAELFSPEEFVALDVLVVDGEGDDAVLAVRREVVIGEARDVARTEEN